jgi:hypothetical protein
MTGGAGLTEKEGEKRKGCGAFSFPGCVLSFFFGSFSIFCPLFILGFGLNKALF